MKRNKLMIIFLSTGAFLVGCDKEETTSQQLDNAQAKAERAAQDMKDYTYAQKSAFVETMKAQLAALNRDLDQLSDKIERANDSVKVEAKPKLQALRDQTDKLNQQLEQAQNATESTWEDVKAGSKKAYNQLKDSFQQARQWVSDKIAP
jgi:DNA anti-recombination protein RmuC